MRNEEQAGTLAWLNRTIDGKKRYILSLVCLQILVGAGSVCTSLLFRTLIDRAVGRDTEGFWRAVICMAALALGQLTLRCLGNFLYEWSRATIENQLKEKLFSCLLRKDYASVTAVHSGEWMNRLTSDTVVVAHGIIEIIPGLTGLLTRMVGALAAIFVLEPVFIAILLPGGGAVLLLTYAFRKLLKRLYKQIREADGAVRVFLQERLGSLMIVHTFAMEKKAEESAREKMNRHKDARIRRNHLSNLCSTAFGLAANGLYLFGAAYCGYGILKGEISYGTMMAMLQLIGQVQSPFANLTGYLPRYYAVIASAERLKEAEDFDEDCVEEPVEEAEILRIYKEELQGFGLRGASFTYTPPVQENSSPEDSNSGQVVLKEIDLEIRKGEFVAFTGHSGCGKSTILKLLMSLYPLDAGERYLVGRRGMAGRRNAIEEYSANEGADQMTGGWRTPLTARWRGLFAYVPQGNQLMSGTIREIISLGDKEKMGQEQRLQQALEIACAQEFVNALEDGLDTELGERGSGLSEGQMQRIAIARAIFSGRPVLMLDESTSALDGVTEQRLLANLRAMTNKTVLIVTHREEALRICDKQIIMTEDGRLAVKERILT